MNPLGPGVAAANGGAEVLLGIDGGGPTTQAVVADLTGRILGRGRLSEICFVASLCVNRPQPMKRVS